MPETGNSALAEHVMVASSSARWAAFLVATALLAAWSRRSLRSIHAHGFYRFLVLEAILALIIINLPFWFSDAFSWHQIVSWSLLLASLVPLIMGVRALHRLGESGAATRDEPELLAFERTNRLVQEGIFRYIRHPMYSSLLLLAWGVFFKFISIPGLVLALLSTTGIFVMARIEERENLRAFGEAYRRYMVHTKRFIPRVL